MTIRDALNINRKFKPEVLAAVKEYRASKPWAGELAERIAKLAALHEKLCSIYGKQISLNTARVDSGVPAAFLNVEGEDANPVEDVGATPQIILSGRISVQRYLTTFHYAVFQDGHDALSWGVSLFVRMFPTSAAKLYAVGPYLVSAASVEANGTRDAIPMATIIAEARAAAAEPAGTVTASEPLPDDAPPVIGNPENN